MAFRDELGLFIIHCATFSEGMAYSTVGLLPKCGTFAFPTQIRVTDPTEPTRTLVLLKEPAEGGWGIAGTAFGREEFAALASKA